MTLEHSLVLFSAILSIAGASSYIYGTLKGYTKPNRVTWFLWTIIPLIGTVIAVSNGADIWAASRVFLAGFLPFLVFTASFFNPKSFWKLSYLDYVCGFLSLLALGVWLILNMPSLAIIFAVLTDGFAAFPTIYKAWTNPNSESGFTFFMGFIAGILILPSIPVWNVDNAAFPLYLIFCDSLLAVLIYRKKILAFFSVSYK